MLLSILQSVVMWRFVIRFGADCETLRELLFYGLYILLYTSVCFIFQADAMLVKNAQNLMQAVVKTLKAAEAACVKVTQKSKASFQVINANNQKQIIEID